MTSVGVASRGRHHPLCPARVGEPCECPLLARFLQADAADATGAMEELVRKQVAQEIAAEIVSSEPATPEEAAEIAKRIGGIEEMT